MKTSINKIKIIFCLLAASTLLTTIPANAQWSKYSNYNAGRQHNLFLGFEALAGTRTFSLNSDHIQFNELSVLQEGRTIGMVVGTNSILLKLRQGQYQSDKNVDLREQTVTFNVSPLQFTRKKPKYINPYILFGFDNNIISLYGDPLPVTSLNGGNNNNGNIGQDHCCCLPEDNFPDEDMDQSSLQEEIMNPGSGKNHVGDLKVLRTDIGAGVMLNISSKKLFTKLFAEAKYGTQSTSRTATQGLKNTWASDQITISFGVVVGLNLAGLSRY